jgi:tetratricopeptide (TPR) repeat protein
LCGRERELDILDRAWNHPELGTRLVSVVAFAGVGKTALVLNWWLHNGVTDAARVLGWSFSSQGGGEGRQVSADIFLDEALRDWFGVLEPPRNSWERGELLAELIRKERSLLILDGLESLQTMPNSEYGSLQDPGMLALLKELVADSPGLCICTSRFPLSDLEGYGGRGFQPINLDNLSPEAGAKYLASLGVVGVESDFRHASEEFDNHPLALTLLGRYLVDRRGADIRKRDTIPSLFADPNKGGHARRVLREYEDIFANTSELGILRLLGLFDRPAEPSAIRILRELPILSGLTDGLINLGADSWATSLERLRAARLVKYVEPDGVLDCHQLVREHFSSEFRDANAESFRSAQKRLFEYYSGAAPEFPDTIDKMRPLFYAVYHGCHAGLFERARKEIYSARILRGEQYFLPRSIGSFGSDLSMLGNFFDTPWSHVVPEIAPADKRWLMSLAGIALRGVGRLAEAVAPTMLAAEGAYDIGEWETASRGLLNLSRLHLALGELQESAAVATRSVEAANRTTNSLLLMSSRCALADVLCQIEETTQAEQLFLEAEAIQARREPDRPILYSLQGYWYCEYLITKQATLDVLNRAQRFLEWSGRLLLDRALCHLLLGKASPNGSEQARIYLDQAVENLRRAGQVHYVPRGLLARAAQFRCSKLFLEAEKDLTEAWILTVRCGMRPHMVDCLIERSRLWLAQERWSAAIGDCSAAQRLAGEVDPRYRRAELQELVKQIAQNRSST